jgi:hypothetical protein
MGGGFDGNTPTFFLQQINHPTWKYLLPYS